MYRQERPASKWFRFTFGNRRSVAKRSRVDDQRLKTYRPRFETLEARLPPGDTVLGGLLAASWAGSTPCNALFIAQVDSLLAPEGRRSVARGVSLWEAVEQSFAEPRRGDRGIVPLEFLSPFQGSERKRHADSQGSRPGLPSVAPPGLGDEMTDWIVNNQVRQRAPMPLSASDGHAIYRPADAGNGFTGLILTQPFWVKQALPTAERTTQEIRLPALPLESVADGESAPAGPGRGVHALFNLDVKTEAPFPTNVFTVSDRTQNTGRRVNLPYPDCNVYVSDCEDIAVLNTLDGFNMQPRLSVPFDGAIDSHSVNSQTMFLVSLGDTLNHHDQGGQVVGINQVVWDVATTTLHVESDDLLEQHTRYALIVTNGIRDAQGNPVEPSAEFRDFRRDVHGEYRHELEVAVHAARRAGVRERDIVAASVFTTESATAILEKIRDQIHAATPEPADFNLGPNRERTVFNLADVTGIHWEQQTGDDPPSFTPTEVNLAGLDIIPGAVGQLAFGKYVSPDYEVHPGEHFPPVATLTGTPIVQSHNDIYFNLFLPSGRKPEGGWPVAMFGHGLGGNKQGPSVLFASSMAAHGIATIAINVVGHGFGPLGTLTVDQKVGESVMLPAGGRGIDQDGDHVIGGSEGLFATGPRTIIGETDGNRQTVVDFMQLVRVIQVGIDVDGNGGRDLDPSQIYYYGQSVGAQYGTDFLAVEPDVRTGVLNVAGGSFFEGIRLSPDNRSLAGSSLATRVPSLINSPGITRFGGVAVPSGPYFNENMPLRNGIPLAVRLEDGTDRIIQSPVINDVVGAMALQEVFTNRLWVNRSANPVAYAPHLRKNPLAGVPAKSVIIQFAKGDRIVQNPITTALLRAGDLADRATYYRNDLAFADDPAVPTNPHGFAVNYVTNPDPLVVAIALGAQEQIATFFESDGQVTIHPSPERYFEVPIQGPLPVELNYIP